MRRFTIEVAVTYLKSIEIELVESDNTLAVDEAIAIDQAIQVSKEEFPNADHIDLAGIKPDAASCTCPQKQVTNSDCPQHGMATGIKAIPGETC